MNDDVLGELKKHTQALGSIEHKLPDAGATLGLSDAGPEVEALHAALLKIGCHVPDKEVSLSRTKLGLERHGVINVVAPAGIAPLAAEYERMLAAVGKHLDEGQKLGDAKETAEQQDLSFLQQATGWDARLLALSATAEENSSATGLSPKALYALYRMGLPTDERLLSLVPPATVASTLSKAAEAGVVSFGAGDVKKASVAFGDFAKRVRRTVSAPGGASSFGALLDASGLTGDAKTKFEDLFFTHANDGEVLFAAAKTAGLSDAQIAALQLQGKLAHLTLNNAPLIASLAPSLGTPDKLSQLVDRDFHKPATWRKKITDLAAGDADKLDSLVPPAYRGDKIEDRLSAYAADMARKMRLSFPTHIVARMIQTGELNLGARFSARKDAVRSFLQKATALDFSLGRRGLSAFTRDHRASLFPASTSDKDVADTVAAVKHVQRLYQITPSDEAMIAAANAGITSARQVAEMPRQAFLDRYAGVFGSSDTAELVYRKAQQVAAVTTEVAASAGLLASAPEVYALTGGSPDAAKTELIKHFPALESLFGSVDYCACDHCRSVLGPAAYLVDVLRFLDPDDAAWIPFLSGWFASHGEEYLKDWTDGGTRTAAQRRPLDALMERRPDLPNLRLTCENTNTVLPYIDVVNEILEYQVAGKTLAAHDTGDAKSEDLIAEPQFLEKPVYDAGGGLQSARYPLSLPFHLPLATVRRILGRFQVSFADLLSAFRPTDALYDTTKPYARAAVFLEQLGLSPLEARVFTNPEPLVTTGSQPGDVWYKLYGYASDTAAKKALSSAKTLSRRLGVSSVDLVALVQTWFVNPSLKSLTPLWKLGIEPYDVLRYEAATGYPAMSAAEKAKFEAYLNGLKTAAFDPLDWLKKTYAAGLFAKVLVLGDDGKAACDFSGTTLRHADGTAADALEHHRLNLLVRLWKKLGWTLDETDRALGTLLPSGATSLSDASKLGPALATALLYLSHLEMLHGLLPLGKDGRVKLLVLWGDIPISGKDSLYAQLFLTPAALRADPVFDDPLGSYLSKTGVLAKDHLAALQGALGLGAADVERILRESGQSLEVDPSGTLTQAPLTIATVSLLYRVGLLAAALRLPVADLITLKHATQLDPFTAVASTPITLSSLDQDILYARTLKFVQAASAMSGRGLAPGELDYLFYHRYDALGAFRTDAAVPLALIRTLAAQIRKIRGEHPADDPAAAPITDEALRSEIGLVLPADVADTFFAMWTGKATYTATETAASTEQLDPTKAPLLGASYLRASYDAVLQRQTLVCTGVLTDFTKASLLSASLPAPQKALLSKLLGAIQAPAKDFFATRLQAPLGFLAATDFEDLFARPIAGESETAAQKRDKSRRVALVHELVPFLVPRLVQRSVVDALTPELGLDPATVTSLLTRATGPFSDPSSTGHSLIDALAASTDRGATATYFPDGGGPSAVTTTASLDTAGATVPLKGAVFEGYLEVPESGAYRFFVKLDKKDAEAMLFVGDGPDPLLRAKAAKDGDELSQPTTLPAGALLPFRFVASGLNSGNAAVLVQGASLPKGPVSSLALLPGRSAERVRQARVLSRKAARTMQLFDLGRPEAEALLDGFFGATATFPARSDAASDTAANALWGLFERLAAYTALREALGGTDDLLGVFRAAVRHFPATADSTAAKKEVLDDVVQRVAALTRADVAAVSAAASQLGDTPTAVPSGTGLVVTAVGFTDEAGVGRLRDVLALVGRLGITVAAAARWATPAPSVDTAEDLRGTVKAQFDAGTWHQVAQPIFDELRKRRRDALVAYVLANHPEGFASADELFEYFLVDSEVEPVVQTSRLRLAISSVQNFVQRAFMNLEPHVAPSALDASRWAWMKRYRVWEANRKIFLYPENFLEPELRDDQTHLYRELMGSLLKGDVSNDLAEDAFFKYLQGLDTIARLEIVTSYRQTDPLHPEDETLHVIGRTHSLPHKYFYRRRFRSGDRSPGMWTPWEPVDVDIEGDHVVTAVWRGRLHLFWVTFLEKGDSSPVANKNGYTIADTRVSDLVSRVVEVQLSFAEYFQGAWTTRTSGGYGDPLHVTAAQSFTPRDAYIWVTTHERPPGDGSIHINMWPFKAAFQVRSRNALPEVVGMEDPDNVPTVYWPLDIGPTYWLWEKNNQPSEGLEILVVNTTKLTDGEVTDLTVDIEPVLRKGTGYSMVFPVNPQGYTLPDPYDLFLPAGPFFYQNSRDTFHVDATVNETQSLLFTGFALPPPAAGLAADATRLNELSVTPFVPARSKPGDPPFDGDPAARFGLGDKGDWLTAPGVGVRFGDGVVGASGHVGVPAAGAVGARGGATTRIDARGAAGSAGPAAARRSSTGIKRR